jgi:hypothetical protein
MNNDGDDGMEEEYSLRMTIVMDSDRVMDYE